MVSASRLTPIPQRISKQPVTTSTSLTNNVIPRLAPTEVGKTVANNSPQVAQIETTVKQYYSMIKGMGLPMYLAQRDLLWPTFFAGEALQNIQATQMKQTSYDYLHEGHVVVTIEEISADGRAASVRVIHKGWLTNTIDIATQTIQATRVHQPDATLMLHMEFFPSENRWKITQMHNTH